MNQHIPFTREAYQDLQSEYHKLIEEQKALKQRLQQAREMGDLSENAAYKYAKIELGSVNRELRRLKYLLDNGEIREKVGKSSSIEFGCTVTLQRGTVTQKYVIVSQHESDPTKAKISTTSPLGLALVGKRVGDRVTVQAPAGNIEYTIITIE